MSAALTRFDMSPADMAGLHGACFTTPRPWTGDEIASLLASPYVFALFAKNGFLMGRVVASEAELLTLAIDPAARRQGQARDLVTRFLDVARARAAEIAFLEVAANNAGALALYHACGFGTSGLRRAYYHQPCGAALDAVVMSCPVLAQPAEI